MMKVVNLIFACLLLLAAANTASSLSLDNWEVSFGVHGFKYSVSGIPNEIGYNPVFERWEYINTQSGEFDVVDYSPLEPLYFNISMGLDAMFRYKTYLMVKVGYDYSNPFGIGGSGNISYYYDNNLYRFLEEEKTFYYTTHQVNVFIGPYIPVNNNKAAIYAGFAPMAPTWVSYTEEYAWSQFGRQEVDEIRTFTGFFGSCRALLGMEVMVSDRLSVGSEMVFTYMNYMKLESHGLEDQSFQFPDLLWNFTCRYHLE